MEIFSIRNMFLEFVPRKRMSKRTGCNNLKVLNSLIYLLSAKLRGLSGTLGTEPPA